MTNFNKLNLWNDRKIEDRPLRLNLYPSRGPYQKKTFKKLTPSDIDLIRTFITDHIHLNHENFEKTLNRLFLHRDRPKNWTLILEILSDIN